MAYASTITVTEMQAASFAGWLLEISETDAAASSEVEIVLADYGLPAFGRVITQAGKLTSGSGANIDPILGSATDPSTAIWRVENATPHAHVHNVPATGIPYGNEITSFFHRSGVNTGTDNAITSRYYILKGWPV
jgi:hypothetical protein